MVRNGIIPSARSKQSVDNAIRSIQNFKAAILVLLVLLVGGTLYLDSFVLSHLTKSSSSQEYDEESDHPNSRSLSHSVLQPEAMTTHSSSASTTKFVVDNKNKNKKKESSWMLAALDDLGVAKYSVYRNKRVQSNFVAVQGDENIGLPLVMVVHHREFFAGCHTFERFFSPKWETVFVLEEDIVENFGLIELAQKNDSKGVHFAILKPSVRTGEWLGKAVALRIMTHASIAAPLLLSIECDSQPLPEFHKKHQSFEQIVTTMVTEFLKEDELNRHGETNINDYNHMYGKTPVPEDVCGNIFSKVDRPLLVMNTAILETLPSRDTFKDSLWHGFQVGFSRNWKNQYDRPDGLAADKPWMSDVSTFVEDHMTLYNATLLVDLVPRLLPVANTISMGVFAIPMILCEKGYKAVRLNEVALFYDYGKAQLKSKSDTTGEEFALYQPSKYGSVSQDWLKTKALNHFSDVSGHSGCLEEYMRLRVIGKISIWQSCVIGIKHIQTNHIPKQVWEQPVRDNEDLIGYLFKTWGYTHVKSTADKMVFVSVESIPPPNYAHFLKHLKDVNTGQPIVQMRTVWLITDKKKDEEEERLEWNVLQLDRNSMLNPNQFFHDDLTNRAIWNPDAKLYYDDTATILCNWIRSWNHRIEFKNETASAGLVTSQEILQIVSHFEPTCPLNFKW